MYLVNDILAIINIHRKYCSVAQHNVPRHSYIVVTSTERKSLFLHLFIVRTSSTTWLPLHLQKIHTTIYTWIFINNKKRKEHLTFFLSKDFWRMRIIRRRMVGTPPDRSTLRTCAVRCPLLMYQRDNVAWNWFTWAIEKSKLNKNEEINNESRKSTLNLINPKGSCSSTV